MTPNQALQADKVKLSRLLHSQNARQFAFAAELGRCTGEEPYDGYGGVSDGKGAPNNSMQRTALRAAADAERWVDQ